MIDKGIRINCDRCTREIFMPLEDVDEEDTPVNLCGDIGKGGWMAVKLPELTILCPRCKEEFMENITDFMDWCP